MTSDMPQPASRPISCGRSFLPADSSAAPARISSPLKMMFSPGAAGLVTPIVPSSKSSVCSCMTTQSAPCGRAPPVGIRMQESFGKTMSAGCPMLICPAISRMAGSGTLEPKVSAALQAKPSTVERSKGGSSLTEHISCARILPQASARLTVSVLSIRSNASLMIEYAVSGVTTCSIINSFQLK